MSVSHDNVALSRINKIVDEGSFVELGGSVISRNTDFCLKDLGKESDGVVTGYGLIDGRLVFIYSQNPEVLGGSIGEMHCQKIISLYEQALKVGAPVIAILDSTGLRLQEGVDALDAFGCFINVVNEASGIIPMFSICYGNCGGGLSVIPSLSDYSYVVKESGHLFVNSPNVIDNNYTEKCDSSNGDYQALYSGIVDLCASFEEIRDHIYSLLEILPANNTEGTVSVNCQDDLNRMIEAGNGYAYDAAVLLNQIADDHIFIETKKAYAPDMITGFLQLNGITVGAFANHAENGRLTVDAIDKATNFVLYCDAYDIPLLSILDLEGYETSFTSEKSLSKTLARFVTAIADADVPKVNLIPKKAISSAYSFFNSKALGADFVYAWPSCEVGILPTENACKILFGDHATQEEIDKFASLQNSVEGFASRGSIDRVIDPASTRKYLISAFDLLFTKFSLVQNKKHSLR